MGKKQMAGVDSSTNNNNKSHHPTGFVYSCW